MVGIRGLVSDLNIRSKNNLRHLKSSNIKTNVMCSRSGNSSERIPKSRELLDKIVKY
jgi:hypothetical protein